MHLPDSHLYILTIKIYLVVGTRQMVLPPSLLLDYIL